MLAADEAGKILSFLIRVRPALDLVDAEVGVRAVGQADGGGRPRHLFDGDRVLEIAKAEPAIVFRHRDAVQAQLAHLGPEVAGKLVRTVDLRCPGRDLGLGELVDGFANGFRCFGMCEL